MIGFGQRRACEILACHPITIGDEIGMPPHCHAGGAKKTQTKTGAEPVGLRLWSECRLPVLTSASSAPRDWFAALRIRRSVEARGIVHHGFHQRRLDAISLSRLSQQGRFGLRSKHHRMLRGSVICHA